MKNTLPFNNHPLIGFSLALSLIILPSCKPSETIPAANLDYLNLIPDVNQTSAKGTSFGDGQQFCGPAAAANALSWLVGTPEKAQPIMLTLASDKYMNTSLKIGTGLDGFIFGIDRFARKNFEAYARLERRGWRHLSKRYKRFDSNKLISPEWLAAGLSNRSAVWLNIGWYTYKKSADRYDRIGGHWVTLVGYDFSDENQLIIHDPSPRAGAGLAHHTVAIAQITAGRLSGNKKSMPKTAAGLFKINNGIPMKRRADVAIIDAAVRLDL